MQFITALLLVEVDHNGNQNSFGPIANVKGNDFYS